MLTYKLKLKNISDVVFVSQKQQMYSYAFRKLYKNFEKVDDPEFKKWMQKEFELDSWDWSSLKEDVKLKVEMVKVWRAKILKKILGIEESLSELVGKKRIKRSERKFYQLTKKLNYFKKIVSKDVVFGGRGLLRKVSLMDENYLDLKKEYLDNRLLPICSVGEANQKGNRKVNFDFENLTLTYKPNKNNHVKLDIYPPSKKRLSHLLKVQELAGLKQIPVMIKLTKSYVYITFDECALNGYRLDKKLFVKNDKQINQKVYQDHRELLSKGKIGHRFCGVDLNPEYIGFSICDKLANGKIKQVHKECLILTNLNERLSLSSEDERQIYQNNKRKHEICESWKYIFEVCSHYKVANFVMEELNFKENSNLGKSANRKCKNL